MPAKGTPKGKRPACAGKSTCAGSCDGSTPSCTYPSGTKCGEGCSGGNLTASACDGKGACAVSTNKTCGGFACNGSACWTSCASNVHCAPTFVCSAKTGRCNPDVTKCSDDGTAIVHANETTTPCGPTRCRDAQCIETCASDGDCATGHVCAGGRCERPTAAAPAESGGCSLVARGAPAPLALAWIVVLAGASYARRRSIRSRAPVVSSSA